jgi:hypothetical protein
MCPYTRDDPAGSPTTCDWATYGRGKESVAIEPYVFFVSYAALDSQLVLHAPGLAPTL